MKKKARFVYTSLTFGQKFDFTGLIYRIKIFLAFCVLKWTTLAIAGVICIYDFISNL